MEFNLWSLFYQVWSEQDDKVQKLAELKGVVRRLLIAWINPDKHW